MEEKFNSQNNGIAEELEKDVEVTEIDLNEDEINEWIAQLAMLKATKNPIQLEIDDDTELSINYDEGDEE
ncbi:hypothetical protein GOV13_02330 [Candidatus Pacearchaeota archaeon]|nr:hypothetical protein [Candidatus Pacearchaeota archaeon]